MEQLVLVKVGLKELEWLLLAIMGLGLIMVIPKQEQGPIEVVPVEELGLLKVGPIVELGLLEVAPVKELVQPMVALEKLVLIFKTLVPI
jgi:hypothetical protein